MEKYKAKLFFEKIKPDDLITDFGEKLTEGVHN